MSVFDLNKTLALVKKKLHKYATTLRYSVAGKTLDIEMWSGEEWAHVANDETIDIGPFGQAIWLIPSDDTLFQYRKFPVDLIARKDLDEAVLLDIPHWSPWGAESGYFYISKREAQEWQLSIWVWNKKALEEDLAHLVEHKHPLTHILPQDVWRMAALSQVQYPALYIEQNKHNYTYHFLIDNLHLVALEHIETERQAQQFWRSLGIQADSVKSVVYSTDTNVAKIPWCPPIEPTEHQLRLPTFSVLERGMLPGVRDWRHPSAWKPVIYGLSALVFIWMLGSSLVIWTKEQQITSALALATEGAEEVIQARDRVDDIGSKLTIINQLNTRQQLPLVLLRDLAVALPEDVWLQTLTLNQDLLELRGQGKNAATLAGQLEKIARVKRVSYVGDIRPDPQSGQEFFALRLQIDNGKND